MRPAVVKYAPTIAELAIRAPGKMTPKGRREIAKWLRRQADRLVAEGKGYTFRTFRARYLAIPLTVVLAACQSTVTACPPWPVAGHTVAAELERLPDAEYPALWGWISRLGVLRDQLEACRG